MAPGIQVSRSDPGQFAVTCRGFLGEFANKLLVLIDGRSVYSPLFSGTLWDYRDVLLENIERIEVIRGPGATLWGAGAMSDLYPLWMLKYLPNMVACHIAITEDARGPNNTITLDEVAGQAGTISNEILTGLSHRPPRIWTDHGGY